MKTGDALRTAAGLPREARETAERVKLLFQYSPEGYATSAFVGAAVVFFLWNEVSRQGLLAWLAWVLLVCAGRYALYTAYARRTPPAEKARAWERTFAAGSALMGFAWAALPAVLYPERSTELQLVVTFIVAVMGMGAAGAYGPSLLAFAFFAAPMAIAMVMRLFLQGGPLFIGIGVVAIFYVALLARIWKEFHKSLTDTIRVRFENADLIAQLRRSQEALADAVESLPEAVAIYDAEDRLVLCNRKYAQAQTAFDDPAAIVGKSFAELVRLSVAKGEEIEPEFTGDVEAWVAERIRRREKDLGQAPRVYRIADGRWMLTGISRTRAGGTVAVRTDITRLREIENSLKAVLDEQELIFEGATTGIAFIKERAIVRCNRRFAEMFGYAREELIGQPTQILYGSGEGWKQVGRDGYPRIERGETYHSEVQGRRRDGEAFWMQLTGRLVDPADAAKGSIWVVNDVDDRRRAEDALKAALTEEQRIMDTATVGIVFLKDRRVVKCNRHFAVMFAYAQEELIGHSSAIWYPSMEAWQKAGGEAYAIVERGEPCEFEQEVVKKNGERFWCHIAGRMLDASDPARGSIWVYTDVTERKTREEEIRELAHHDALTGLPNRRLLDDRMTQAFASARRGSEHVALMLLDLDRFKPVNDSHGHEAGDAVLKVVASRLKGCVREADTVARVGGDEFVVMLLVHVPKDAVRVAEKILDSLAQPIPVAGNEFQIGASIGISVYPEDATERETLLNCADRAMYYVKAAGRNSYRFYSREQAPAQV